MNRVGVTAITIAAIGTSGCGSSSSSSGSGTSAASYRTQVNKICASANAQVKALPASTSNSIAGLQMLLSLQASTLAQIKAVSAPSSLRSQVSEWLGVVDQEEGLATKLVGEA